MTANPAHINNMASLLERDEDNDVGQHVVLHNLSFFYDNFDSINQIFDGDTSIQDEFITSESEVYDVFVYLESIECNFSIALFINST